MQRINSDLMPALDNPRWEEFAKYLAKGQTQVDAYKLAGYKSNPKAASTLSKKPAIRQRVDEIRERIYNIDKAATERAIERLALTKESLAREYIPLITSNMRNYVEITPVDGDPYFDFSKVTDEQWKAVKAMTIEEFMDGRGNGARAVKRVKFQLHDKVGPGQLIAKLFGWIIERKEDITRIEERLRNMTPEQREKDAEDLYNRAIQRLLEDDRSRGAADEGEGGIGGDSLTEGGK